MGQDNRHQEERQGGNDNPCTGYKDEQGLGGGIMWYITDDIDPDDLIWFDPNKLVLNLGGISVIYGSCPNDESDQGGEPA